MDSVYIFGHRNPDTDSICSAVAYANFKNITCEGNFIPGRLGDIRRETEFVLDYFNVPSPKLVEDVYTRLLNIPFESPVNVKKDTSLFKVWSIMMEQAIRTVNIVGDNGRFLGLATLGDIAKSYLGATGDFSKYIVPLKNIAFTLKANYLFRAKAHFSGHILVAALEPEQIRDHLSGNSLLIAGNRENVMHLAIEKGINTLVITGGYMPPVALMDAARTRDVNLMVTPYDTFNTVKLINQSLPIHYVMQSKDLVTFERGDLLEDVRETMLRHKYRYFPLLDSNRKPFGILTRRHLLGATGKKVILVDHNEKSQSALGIEQARILEVIDHHRIAAMETAGPIVFINRPVGSTATIIYSLYRQRALVPDASIAGIMCAAILSDTLVFKSPTCTAEDVDAAKALSIFAGIDIDTFVRAMFREGTSLKGKSPKDIFYTDFKDFSVAGLKIGVAQINIYKTSLGPIKEDLLQLMEEIKTSKDYHMLLLMLTDIIDEGSEFLHVGDQHELLSKAFDITVEGESFYLPLVVSRKQQVIPKLVSAIKQN